MIKLLVVLGVDRLSVGKPNGDIGCKTRKIDAVR